MGIIPPTGAFDVIHREAVTQANSWRARCINLFARGERVVGAGLAVVNVSGKQPQHLKTKLNLLAKLLAHSANATQAIERFQSFLELRNIIVHNEARIFADLKGAWIIQFDALESVPKRISDTEAEAIRREIQQAVDKLAVSLKINSRSSNRAGTPSA